MKINMKNLQKNNQKNVLLEQALHYRRMGWSPFPVKSGDKTPLIKWEKYQSEIATEEEICNWWAQFPDANIGIATGKVSGIVVVDVDAGGSTEGLSPTVMARTGGGGDHLFYKHPGVPIKNSVKKIAPFTDIRGDGGYVVVAPSLHKTGRRYEWLIAPEDAGFEDLPKWILEKCAENGNVKKDWKEFPTSQVKEGARNDTAASYAGKLLHDLSPELWEGAGWTSLKKWNDTNVKPPLSGDELRAVFQSIAQKETASRKEEKKEDQGGDAQADRLVKFVFNDPTITLFHDELDTAYAKFVAGKHRQILLVDGSAFKRWLSKSYYDLHKKTPSQNVLSAAMQTIAGRACFDGEAIKLHTRAAMIDNVIWYDLADKEWRAVRITAEGWSVVDDPPTIFRRQQHQAAQVLPASGGNIRDILRFVNITEESQQVIFLVLLVSYFIPGFPHPIAYVYGPQGSAKSTLSKIKRKLVDPSRIEVLSLPRKEEDLVQVLSHHYQLFFDNVGTMSDSVSDLLCRAVTGSGFSKRQLYTNDEDIIYNIQANIGINGINLSSSRPDLLERSVLFELRRVEKAGRRQERELLEEFERERPKILGAIFDTLARALALKPTIVAPSLPRMADFAVWGCAIAEAMGFPKEVFLNAYNNNIDSQNAEVLGEHIEAELLGVFIEGRGEWTGTMSELFEHLKADTKSGDDFPKSANALSRKLNTLKINLEEAGIIIIRNKGTRRTLTIRKTPANIVDTADTVQSVTAEQLGKDAKDDTGDITGDFNF